MPTSYGNSCLRIRILVPCGPSRYPPKALARLSKVLCRSISQLSIVVTLFHTDHKELKSVSPTAKRVKELRANRVNKESNDDNEGPRY